MSSARLAQAIAWVVLAACSNSAAPPGSDDPEDPCEAWKDAALRYSMCEGNGTGGLVGRPRVDQKCISDDAVAEKGPRTSVAECASYVDSLIHECVGLEVSRAAYMASDDKVVFDYISEGNPRPKCQCDRFDSDIDIMQCGDVIVRTD